MNILEGIKLEDGDTGTIICVTACPGLMGGEKRPGIHSSHMHVNLQNETVNVSMNNLSHMARSSKKAVFNVVRGRTRKLSDSELIWLQSSQEPGNEVEVSIHFIRQAYIKG